MIAKTGCGRSALSGRVSEHPLTVNRSRIKGRRVSLRYPHARQIELE